MVRKGAKFELRSGVHYALTRMKERHYPGLKVKTNHEYHPVNLTVKPFTPTKETKDLVMVTFEDVVGSGKAEARSKRRETSAG